MACRLFGFGKWWWWWFVLEVNRDVIERGESECQRRYYCVNNGIFRCGPRQKAMRWMFLGKQTPKPQIKPLSYTNILYSSFDLDIRMCYCERRTLKLQ